MCGRINLSDNEGVQALMRMLGMPLYQPPIAFEPRWNLSPTSILNALVATPVAEDEIRPTQITPTQMRWGIKAPWSEPGKSARALINARSETLFSKPTFKEIAKTHRAIVPVTGFYEWQRLSSTPHSSGDKRIPYYVQVQGLPAMLLATVFQPVTADDIEKEQRAKQQRSKNAATPQMGFAFDDPMIDSVINDKRESPTFTGDFAIVTTQATGDLARIHHRTPVMLNTDQALRWLHSDDLEELKAMMTPDAVMAVTLTQVSAAVNSTRNDGPECAQPITTHFT